MKVLIRSHGRLVETRAVDDSKTLVTIGRLAGNDIVLDDPQREISRYHAVLVRGGEKEMFVRDLGSVAGTYLLVEDDAGNKLQRAVVQASFSERAEVLIGPYAIQYALRGSELAEPIREAPERDSESGAEETRGPDVRIAGIGDHDIRALDLARTVSTFARLCADDMELFDWTCDLLKKYFGTSVVRASIPSSDDEGKRQFPGTGELELPEGSFERLKNDGGKVVRSRSGKTIAVPLRGPDRNPVGFIGLGPDGCHGEPFVDSDVAFVEALANLALSERATDRRSVRKRAIPWPMHIVGSGPEFRKLEREIDLASRTSRRVLLLGGTGAGKTAIAAEIHRRSSRSKKPFIVPQNITGSEASALSAENELFGESAKAPGMRTPGRVGTKGAFERANEGTLFIDELDALEPALLDRLKVPLGQSDMGTSISIVRLGGIEPVTVDVRLICATNKDLDEEVRAGRMLADFPRRVAQHVIDVPPLNKRKEDIPLLAHFLADQYAASRGMPARQISHLVIRKLMQIDYPDNVGGLLNRVRAAFDRAVGPVLTLQDFGFDEPVDDEPTVLAGPGGLAERATSEKSPASEAQSAKGHAGEESDVSLALPDKKRLAENALAASGGNITAAARRIGVHRNTLLHWMDRYGIQRDRGFAGKVSSS